MTKYKLLLLLLISLLSLSNEWKTCDDVAFCKKLRSNKLSESYTFVPVTVTKNIVQGNLLKNNVTLSAIVTITALQNDIFRVVVNDIVPLNPPRHTVLQVLEGTPAPASSATSKVNSNKIILENEKGKAVIYTNNFKIYVYTNNNLVSIINAKQRLVFETLAPPVSVALDFKFVGAQVAYGLPLHADHLALRTTVREDPYRLFNVDYFGYNVDSTEALYGTVPVLYAHGVKHTSGIFWLNSAQTWVDLDILPDEIDAYLMSETGIIDVFILTGPTLPETVTQYIKLTGTAPLPQYFALGYHQSRYSYMSQDEVKEVVEQFTINNLPLDVVWLDIDYTIGKKYFTWNPSTFPDPIGLQNHLHDQGKKLVAIIDPHIKNETGYFVHDEAVKNGYYILNPDGTNYIGECWPGPSSYFDLTNPKAVNYFASLYKTIDTFQSKGIHIWNDMNEPSVFYQIPAEEKEFEKTIPLDRLHFGNYQHRDVHNIYGFLQTTATRKGMLARHNNTVRPFVLTRSHFAGTQRFAAIWTGDNKASWEHLQFSIPMCLTEALAGISFCGADVGGFTGIPSDELYQRWYQAGAWLPFYRGHSEVSVPRREPYRFSKEIRERVLGALQQRYAHLPVWYTLFYEHEKTGHPVIRPLTYQYPKDTITYNIDNQILVGENILVAPVLIKGASHIQVYLPGGANEIWYNIDNNYNIHYGTGFHTLKVTLKSVPVFYRGGSIIVRKDTPRLSSVETHKDPFTIYVAPDLNGNAKGKIYIDDYETFEYKNSAQYVYINLKFSRNKLSLEHIDKTTYKPLVFVTKIVILNPPKVYHQAKVENQKKHFDVSHNQAELTSAVLNCSLDLHTPFIVELY